MLRLVKMALKPPLELIRQAFALLLLVAWAALGFVFIVATLMCVFFGTKLILSPFFDDDNAVPIAALAMGVSFFRALPKFHAIAKKEMNRLLGW